MAIRARFRVGTLKLHGDADRLGAAVIKLRRDSKEAELRAREFDRAARRLRARLLRVAERAFLDG